MTQPIIIWFRGDLRVHDHPALATAIADADAVVPTFILDTALLHGSHGGSNRNRFLLESLHDLKASLKDRGGDLVVRQGKAAKELVALAKVTNASAVYYIADYSPFATARDKKVEAALEKASIEVRSFGGKLAVNALQQLSTKAGTPHKVFTPFWKQWAQVQRRDVASTPRSVALPNVAVGTLPALERLVNKTELSPDALKGGETEGRKRLKHFLDNGIKNYHTSNNEMSVEGTSRLSAYLHFGCVSVREIETMLPDSMGARSWHRQLAWRDFYYYVLLHFPHPGQEFQERYRDLKWDNDAKLLKAWQDGLTGYPAVDAAMRQLKQEGWMHNRARLIVGCFLSKDLWLDWRLGEAHFMKWLIDGDEANNNGNWQWIASVGVDPAPVFRRMYNPSTQRDRFDPTGNYVRRYVPELKDVPDKYLSQPWTMPDELQHEIGCIIGKHYPGPIVDHKEARLAALERYKV